MNNMAALKNTAAAAPWVTQKLVGPSILPNQTFLSPNLTIDFTNNPSKIQMARSTSKP